MPSSSSSFDEAQSDFGEDEFIDDIPVDKLGKFRVLCV
jgi:hypothetical protein